MANNHTKKTELIGVRLPDPIIKALDDRRAPTGLTRQDIIRAALAKELF